jgi:plastocyanin
MGTYLVRIGRYVIALVCLCSLVMLMAACWPLPDSSSSSNTSAPPQANQSSSSSAQLVMTVMVKEKQGSSGDVYTFDPSTITLHKGDTITITNQSDELQDIDQGDAMKAGIDVKVPVNQSTTATFNSVGTFTLKSEKGAMITVTVQ